MRRLFCPYTFVIFLYQQQLLTLFVVAVTDFICGSIFISSMRSPARPITDSSIVLLLLPYKQFPPTSCSWMLSILLCQLALTSWKHSLWPSHSHCLEVGQSLLHVLTLPLLREPVDSDVEVMSISDDSDPDGTGPVIKNDNEL